jgi:hypothetical protein
MDFEFLRKVKGCVELICRKYKEIQLSKDFSGVEIFLLCILTYLHETLKFCQLASLLFLTAASCPKRDFYTHTPPLKTATEFCTARQKNSIVLQIKSNYNLQ